MESSFLFFHKERSLSCVVSSPSFATTHQHAEQKDIPLCVKCQGKKQAEFYVGNMAVVRESFAPGEPPETV
jgi:hypothetical protein